MQQIQTNSCFRKNTNLICNKTTQKSQTISKTNDFNLAIIVHLKKSKKDYNFIINHIYVQYFRSQRDE